MSDTNEDIQTHIGSATVVFEDQLDIIDGLCLKYGNITAEEWARVLSDYHTKAKPSAVILNRKKNEMHLIGNKESITKEREAGVKKIAEEHMTFFLKNGRTKEIALSIEFEMYLLAYGILAAGNVSIINMIAYYHPDVICVFIDIEDYDLEARRITATLHVIKTRPSPKSIN